MKLYIFSPDDQRNANWLFHVSGRQKNVPVPPYDKFVCGRCGRVSYDDVFAIGFEYLNPVLRARGDIFVSDEGFYCVNDRFRDFATSNNFPGLTFKRIGGTGWNVINFAMRLEVRPDVYIKARPELCVECKRPELIRGVRHKGHLVTIPPSETFFSTLTDRQGSGGYDRDMFWTDGILKAMKRHGIKGGLVRELLDEELDTKLVSAWQRGERVEMPKGAEIIL